MTVSGVIDIISLVAVIAYLVTFEPPERGTTKSYIHTGALVALLVVIAIQVVANLQGVPL